MGVANEVPLYRLRNLRLLALLATVCAPAPARADDASAPATTTLGASDPPGEFSVSGAGDAIWAKQNPRPAASLGLGLGVFAGPFAGQSDQLVRGAATLRIAPIKYLDFGINFLYGYNSNAAQNPTGVTLGFDVIPTVRLGFDAGAFSFGGAVTARIRSGIDKSGPDLSATGVSIRALGDYRPLPSLALHLNLGFVSDNSDNLHAVPVTDAFRAYRFSTELSTATLLVAAIVGADYQVNKYLRPYLTAEFDFPVAGASAGAGQKRITPGLRIMPFKGFALDAQVAVGFGGDVGVPPPPIYLATLLVSYSFWPGLKETVLVAGPSIAGRVTRGDTGAPVEGAVVTTDDPAVHAAATNARGDFMLSGLPAGKERVVRVKLRGFAPSEARALPDTVPLAIALVPRAEACSLTGNITDLDGKPVPSVTALIRSPATRKIIKAAGDAQGHFNALLAPDTYHVTLEAPGFLSLGKELTFGDGATVVFDASLRSRPDVAAANLEQNRIAVSQPINFATGTDQLDDASQLVLEEVASILLMHPEIELIELGGHTDERGDDAMNLDLSQRRAKRVADYLTSRGVEAARLDPKGYGKSRPIGSNRTEAGRAQNRRVEFLIRRQSTAQ